jgi:sulfofructose kinase
MLSDQRNQVDVLCVGHASFDLTLAVPQHPGPDEKCVASSLIGSGGGPAANAAVAVARLGYRAAFAGYLGRDVWGEQHVLELIQAGVLTDLIARGSAPTPLSVVLVKPDGKRSLVNYRGRTAPLPADRIDFSNTVPKVILFDGHEPFLSVPLAGMARDKGIKTVLDAGSVHPGTRALASRVDYLICSEHFAREFTGVGDADQALARLFESQSAVVVTLGENGLIWRTAQGTGRRPAFKVEVVDSTGAGDAFHGAFAACLAAGRAWEETLRYASAVAALCCTQSGARPGIPTRQQVDEFLEARPKQAALQRPA